MALPLNAVLADPSEAASHLLHGGAVFGVEQAVGRRGLKGAAVLDLTLRPLPAFEREGYPVERVRIVIHADHRVHAYPQGGRDRRFKHRNPWPQGDLCLQYAHDDPALRVAARRWSRAPCHPGPPSSDGGGGMASQRPVAVRRRAPRSCRRAATPGHVTADA